MKKPVLQRPKLDIVWAKFLGWISALDLDPTKQIILCAYNGFCFDFRVLLIHLDRYNIKIAPNTLLIDPWYELTLPNGEWIPLSKEFKKSEKQAKLDYSHRALGYARRLCKYHAM